MININIINEVFDNDTESINMIFEMFIEEYEDSPQQLTSLYQEKKWQDLCMYTHSLYGTLAALSEDDVSVHLKKIETDIRQEKEPELSDIETSIAGMSEIKDEVKKLLNS